MSVSYVGSCFWNVYSLAASMFCVGISIAYGIINRLDKLMLAVKEIVGEQYHIHGVGLRSYQKVHPPGYEQGNGRVRFTGGLSIHHAPTENF